MSASETVAPVVPLSADRRIDAGNAKALRYEIGVAEYLGDDRVPALCAVSGMQSAAQPVLHQDGKPVCDVTAPLPGVGAIRLEFSAHA